METGNVFQLLLTEFKFLLLLQMYFLSYLISLILLLHILHFIVFYLKGLGTDDATLIRIVVTHCEVDMAIIKQEFQKIYSKTLADFIKVQYP